MAPKLNGLRAITDERVVEAHNGLAPNTDVGVNCYLDEFVRASEGSTHRGAVGPSPRRRERDRRGRRSDHRPRRPGDHERLAANPPIVAPCTVVEDDRQRPALCVVP
jgi:hypothetical protein